MGWRGRAATEVAQAEHGAGAVRSGETAEVSFARARPPCPTPLTQIQQAQRVRASRPRRGYPGIDRFERGEGVLVLRRRVLRWRRWRWRLRPRFLIEHQNVLHPRRARASHLWPVFRCSVIAFTNDAICAAQIRVPAAASAAPPVLIGAEDPTTFSSTVCPARSRSVIP